MAVAGTAVPVAVGAAVASEVAALEVGHTVLPLVRGAAPLVARGRPADVAAVEPVKVSHLTLAAAVQGRKVGRCVELNHLSG